MTAQYTKYIVLVNYMVLTNVYYRPTDSCGLSDVNFRVNKVVINNPQVPSF